MNKIVLMADGDVGLSIVTWLIENYKSDLQGVVLVENNHIYNLCQKNNINTHIYSNNDLLTSFIHSIGEISFGFLIWWPKIINKEIIALPENGFINTHPSYLPYNRGKHYNFWALVEQVPFGVSLHFVDEGIDSGDIVAQLEIPYDWTDTGGSLYEKARVEMIALFKSSYPLIRSGDFNRKKQSLDSGSFHTSRELEEASRLYLNNDYKCRDLLNLLRARTFSGYPSCTFEDEGVIYEIRVKINKFKGV